MFYESICSCVHVSYADRVCLFSSHSVQTTLVIMLYSCFFFFFSFFLSLIIQFIGFVFSGGGGGGQFLIRSGWLGFVTIDVTLGMTVA